MRKRLTSFILLFCSCIALGAQANARTPAHIPPTQQPSLAPMLKAVMPAIVNLSVRGKLQNLPPSFAPPQNQLNLPPDPNTPAPYPQKPNPPASPWFQDVGSGVIVDAKHGYILTNAHVIHNADIITVSLDDGRHLMGKTIGVDNASDLAVIQIKAKNLTAIPLVPDSDKVQIGDFVAAVGNPFGLQETATYGVVSALNRQIGIEGYEDFIQTDAPINPGNSGGALVNLKGQLIGINTAILSSAGGSVGIGFAIPINMARGVMDQLIRYGKVKRGLLGVIVQNLTPALADAFHIPEKSGALVTTVLTDSPAAEAGLKAGDAILAINGKPIHSTTQVRSMVGVLRQGSRLTLNVRRKNNLIKLYPVIRDPKEQEEKALKKQSPLAGLELSTYDQMDATGQSIKGIQVQGVSDHSLAWFNGVRQGDVILSLNGNNTPNIDSLSKILQKKSSTLLLKIRRFGTTIYLVVG